MPVFAERIERELGGDSPAGGFGRCNRLPGGADTLFERQAETGVPGRRADRIIRFARTAARDGGGEDAMHATGRSGDEQVAHGGKKQVRRAGNQRRDVVGLDPEFRPVGVERAKRAGWYKDKLDHIDPAKLDDPEEWSKIPIIDKDTLRQWSHDEFMAQVNIAPPEEISEYWRSGGTTGQPVFYPRTFEDVDYGLLSWGRSFPCIGIGAGDLCHISFPIGIHPAGQI